MSIVNGKYKHIFIHNPKVAGSWMEKKSFIGGSGHQSLYGYRASGVEIDHYFKWMFVRNPYDRLVSSYSYNLRSLGRPNVSMRNHFWMLESFERYIRNLGELFDFSKTNFDLNQRDFVSAHMIPQHYFACINGENKMDYIGKMESIDKGWQEVTQKLNVKSPLEHSNQSKRMDSWINYYTPELFEIVNHKYQKDFEMFAYPRYTMF